MKLNPIIPQREKLQNIVWRHVQPTSTHIIDLEQEDQKYTYYNESCYKFPIGPYTSPALSLLCKSIQERLRVQGDFMFCIDDFSCIQGTCLNSGNTEYPTIIRLTSGAVNLLTDNELAFLIGHELGHAIMQNGLVQFFFNIFYKDNTAPKFLTHQFHVYQLLSELEADRYGFLACGCNLDTFVSYQYKFCGGIDQQRFGVSTETFLKANQRYMQKFLNGGWLGKRHPANALRIEAIRLFATCKTNRELKAQMKPIIDSIQNCDD